jgi:hypothetical protein
MKTQKKGQKSAELREKGIQQAIVQLQQKLDRGERVTASSLVAVYGIWAARVLTHMTAIAEVTRKSGERQKYTKGKRHLPSTQELDEERSRYFTTTVSDLVSEAYSELQSLAEEVRQWYDGLPENLQSGDKGSRLEQAADTLENLDEPTFGDPEEQVVKDAPKRHYAQHFDAGERVGKIPVVYMPGNRRRTGRSSRRDEATDQMQAVIDELNDLIGRYQTDSGTAADSPYTAAQLDEMQDVVDRLEADKGDAEGVDFPGMYD